MKISEYEEQTKKDFARSQKTPEEVSKETCAACKRDQCPLHCPHLKTN